MIKLNDGFEIYFEQKTKQTMLLLILKAQLILKIQLELERYLEQEQIEVLFYDEILILFERMARKYSHQLQVDQLQIIVETLLLM